MSGPSFNKPLSTPPIALSRDAGTATRPAVEASGEAVDALKRVAWSLDWNLLRTFLVIVQEQSLTAAAARLQLKQPSVSNALKRLERALGVQLIERGPRTFRLTARGRALYRECTGIFGSVSRLASALEQAQGEITGTVQLALASHVVSPLIDDLLAEFHRRHPAACLSICVSSSREVVESVFEKRAALGVCLVRDRLPELEYTLLYTEHFGFFCGPGHRLFGQRGLQLEDLRGERCVSFPTDQLSDVLRPIAMLRAEADFDENVAGMSINLEEIRRMVTAGLGIGALPIHVVERDVRDGLLFRLPPYENPPAIDIWLVRHPEARVNRAEAEFTRLLQKRVAETPRSERVYGLAPLTTETGTKAKPARAKRSAK
ncbi:MAG: LysR family transcriptional regulator [Lysobacterales bacterium]